MGEVVAFPERIRTEQQDTAIDDCDTAAEEIAADDPYFVFIKNLLNTARACGYDFPFSVESTARQVYIKTKPTSHLAQMIEKHNSD